MTDPRGTPGGAPPPPEPGDRPPPGTLDRPPAVRLARPPSERYRQAVPRGTDAGDVGSGLGRRVRALMPALGAAVVTAAALVLVGGVLAEQTGLLAIAGAGGGTIGLLAAGATVASAGGVPPIARGRVAGAAIVVAILAVAGGAVGTWLYGRLEGGVMDPLTYLWTTFGLYVPAEAIIASIAAAWGAGAGPIRIRG